jgi:hypothetical protein
MPSKHGTVGDLDGDGRFDLFVPALFTSALFRNLGNDSVPGAPGDPHFEECAAKSGVLPPLLGKGAWGSGMEDFDQDGDLDLLVVMGGAFDLKAADPDRLFRNDGAFRFTDVSATLGPDFQVGRVSRGAAFGDLDDDGDVDYVVNVKDVGAPPRLLRTDRTPAAGGPRPLTVKLIGRAPGTDAIGAVATLRDAVGAQVRMVNRSNSYLSSCDPRLHFAVRGSVEKATLEVRWPSGRRTTHALAGQAAGRALTLREEDAR